MACDTVAPNCKTRTGYKIMTINQEDFFGHTGGISESEVILTKSHMPDSLLYATTRGAQVYSNVDICIHRLSEGWRCFVPAPKLWERMADALEVAEKSDVMCFFAAIGSATLYSEKQPYAYPAFYNTVIAIHSQDRPCGPQAELFVRGAPHNCGAVTIAGAAGALLRMADPSITAREARQILRETAEHIAEPDERQPWWNASYGYGQLNLYNAVKYVKEKRAINMPEIKYPERLHSPSDLRDISWRILPERNEQISKYLYCIGTRPGYPDLSGGWFKGGTPGVGGMIETESTSLTNLEITVPKNVDDIYVTVEALYVSGGRSLQARSGPIEIA